jgi:hypothetical protein
MSRLDEQAVVDLCFEHLTMRQAFIVADQVVNHQDRLIALMDVNDREFEHDEQFADWIYCLAVQARDAGQA